MGQVYAALSHTWTDAVDTISPSRRKRKRGSDNEDNEVVPNTPKKMRMESTLKFIYKALFLEGKDSDVTVKVLDKEWHLHKMYLQQSPYFESMFSGKWSETNKTSIEIEVNDPNVTADSVNVVFSSCYTDELTVNSASVVNVLAAATLFQMDGVIEQCVDIMKENVCATTVVTYYEAACTYGIPKVKEDTLRWLAVNLVSIYDNPRLLLDIDPDLMEQVVKHKELCVVQSETFLYIVLRMWTYLHCNPNFESSPDLSRSCENFFRKKDVRKSFLEREEGKGFIKVFEALRVDHLVEHIEDALVAEKDNLIPLKWLKEACTKRWLSLLALIANKDNGPVNVHQDLFNAECLRLGLELDSPLDHSWKWNCFTSGVELVWTVSKRALSVERVRGPIDPKRSNSPARRVALKIAVTNVNEKRQVIRRETSPIMEVSLLKNQPMKLLQLAPSFTYPMLIQVYLLLSTPTAQPAQEPPQPPPPQPPQLSSLRHPIQP